MMPAHSSDQPDQSAARNASGSDASPADGADANHDEVPMNRAERRAKGKAAKKPPVVGKIQPARVNNGPAPRSYANRRSGG
jgi:hypothetical protein